MERYPVSGSRSDKGRREPLAALLLNFAALVIEMWGWLYPQPYLLVLGLLAALPWVAFGMALRRPRLYSVDDPDQSHVRGDLTAVLVGPGLVLMLRALRDTNLLEPAALLIPAVLAHLAWLSLLVWKLPALRRPVTLILLAIFLAPYTASVIALANCALDEDGKAVTVTVARKYSTSGKGAVQYLVLPPWGAREQEIDVRVPMNLYLAAQRGGPVCMHLHGGALGMPWVSVSERC